MRKIVRYPVNALLNQCFDGAASGRVARIARVYGPLPASGLFSGIFIPRNQKRFLFPISFLLVDGQMPQKRSGLRVWHSIQLFNTRQISPDEQRGFPRPEDWGK
jgi:hypothetical protein